MRITHIVDTLDSPGDWSRLGRMLGGESLGVVQNTVRHLRVLKAKSYTLKAQNPVQPTRTTSLDRDFARFEGFLGSARQGEGG